jgi:hypothetical protein
MEGAAAAVQELRQKKAEVLEMIFKNEVVIRNMEEVLRRAAADASRNAQRDAACGTAEDFRENWVSSSGSFLSHPAITLDKLDAELAQETIHFHQEQQGFIERVRELQATSFALRSIVQSRLQE